MRFRVTSVTDEETGSIIRDATVKMEDWLNAALGDGDFGTSVEQLVIVVVCVDDDPAENSRFAEKHNKAGRYKHPFSGESISYISFAVQLPPSVVHPLDLPTLLSRINETAIPLLRVRPKRLPKGFDYARSSEAVSKALAVFVQPVA
jgi:hypothetical protein